jgi:transcriptional regulator with XRE-family HTH domain
MNFIQMHERLRLELLRRIQRGTLSISLLARQTGVGQPHLSNFLHKRRQLSMEAADRVLAAQYMAFDGFLSTIDQSRAETEDEEGAPVPVVSHQSAMFEHFIRSAATQSVFHPPPGLIESLPRRGSNARYAWQRFVAVRISGADALAMESLLLPDALALIDRHYTALVPCRPNRPNLYAVRNEGRLTLRYVESLARRLVLRPHSLNFPVELIEPDPGEAPSDLIVGRVTLIQSEL